MSIGKLLPDDKLIKFLSSFEGEMSMIYGKIGNGKTYAATADVLDDLRRGWIVYTTWPIDFNGYDQRDSLLFLVGSILFPWRNTFKVIPKDNLKYLDIFDDKFLDEFADKKNCKVYLDEAHMGFDSYEMTRASMKKRASILHTRHFNRSVVFVTQRPTALPPYIRANINRFYRVRKFGKKHPFILFLRTEYQEMVDETVDETKPDGYKFYFSSQTIFNAYNSKYIGGDLKDIVHFQVYKLNIFLRLYQLLKVLIVSSIRGSLNFFKRR